MRNSDEETSRQHRRTSESTQHRELTSNSPLDYTYVSVREEVTGSILSSLVYLTLFALPAPLPSSCENVERDKSSFGLEVFIEC